MGKSYRIGRICYVNCISFIICIYMFSFFTTHIVQTKKHSEKNVITAPYGANRYMKTCQLHKLVFHKAPISYYCQWCNTWNGMLRREQQGCESVAFLPWPWLSIGIATVILLKGSKDMIVGGSGGPGLAKNIDFLNVCTWHVLPETVVLTQPS